MITNEELEKLTLHNMTILSTRINELTAQIDTMDKQVRVVAKRLNMAIAALQDHEALVNRLAAIEEGLARSMTPPASS